MIANGNRANFVKLSVFLQIPEVKNGEWRAVAAIPFASVGITVVQNNRVRFLFHRGRAGTQGKSNVHSSWGGGLVHSPDSFGELVFALE